MCGFQYFVIVAFLLTVSESKSGGESETSDVLEVSPASDSSVPSSASVPVIETHSILQSLSADVDDALNQIVAASNLDSESNQQNIDGIKSETKIEPETASELIALIISSLNRSGLLRDDIRSFFEQNNTANVLPIVGLQCAILLYNETVDLPFRIKSAAEMNRAYESLSLEGEQIIHLLHEFVKTVDQTIQIIDEVDGTMTQAVKDHITSPFTYENFRMTYTSIVVGIQTFQHKAVQASLEGKVRKDILGAEANKYEGLRNCYNYTKKFLEKLGIYLHSPSSNAPQSPQAFDVIDQLDQVMNLFGQLTTVDNMALSKDDVADINDKIKAKISEHNNMFRYFEILLAKARIEIDSRAQQIIEVNSNITGLRLLNVLSHILILNEKVRISLDRYDLFVRSTRHKDSDEDLEHDEL